MSSASSRRTRGVAASLRIQPPAHQIPVHADAPLSSDSTDSQRSRNMKRLSLALPDPAPARRRPSVVSLPPTATASTLIHRKDEDGDDSANAYAAGPVEIIPGVWIGSEDNARDIRGLQDRRISHILNVAKEVACPLDAHTALKPAASTPNFRTTTFADAPRSQMHYLKLQWSHGQQDLVDHGFKDGFAFVDAALARGEGCLVHCQCGISRSATMVIAIVMRAAAERLPTVPPAVWDLTTMHAAMAYVKAKSPCVGPNMSLIFQLMEYEKRLKPDSRDSDIDLSSATDDEEEWGRRRRALDEEEDNSSQDLIMQQEARALDKAMEERIVARKSSESSMSSLGSGLGMGPAWKNRYARKRTGSVASNRTNGSFLSEDLVEEEEEQEILGIRNLDSDGESRANDASPTTSPDDEQENNTPRNSIMGPPVARVPTSAPAWKTSFGALAPPLTAVRASFELPKPKAKRKPMGLSILPPVPPSPVNMILESDEPTAPPQRSQSVLSLPPVRQRTLSKALPPPLHLRHSTLRRTSAPEPVNTPSQTLFVFPPSPTLNARTPCTMTLTSNINTPVPFPSLSTPRVSTFQHKGRTRSFIGLGAPPTPTVAFSKVDARGYVGRQ